MGKKIELCKVRQGETFTLDGVKFVKLADEHGAVFALTRDVVLKTVPFNEEGTDGEDLNNFSGSNLEETMERWLRSTHTKIYGASVPRFIDLTTRDGMTDYGCPLSTVRALTIDEYRNYRKFIPLTSDPYWLATGWTTNINAQSYATIVYHVSTGGSASGSSVYMAYFAARPALYLRPFIRVSVEEERGLEHFTDTELMDELYRRRRATYDPD